MSVLDLVDEEDKERAKKILERVIAGESVLDEIRYRTKDGKVRWVFGLYRPFFYENKPYAVGNYIDITRAKRLEEKIKESEEFYRMLVDNSFAGIYILQNGRYVFINKAVAKGTGYSEEELLGMDDPFQIIHPEDRDKVYYNYLKSESGARTEDTLTNWRVIRKDGEVRWILGRARNITYKGKPAVYVTTLDVTELYNANEELRRKNEYLSLLTKILRHDILNDLAVIRGGNRSGGV